MRASSGAVLRKSNLNATWRAVGAQESVGPTPKQSAVRSSHQPAASLCLGRSGTLYRHGVSAQCSARIPSCYATDFDQAGL